MSKEQEFEEQRKGSDRRSGVDTRPDSLKSEQGERRSGVDRRDTNTA